MDYIGLGLKLNGHFAQRKKVITVNYINYRMKKLQIEKTTVGKIRFVRALKLQAFVNKSNLKLKEK